MRRHLAPFLPLKHIAPPLQPDLSCKRLVYDLAHPGDFQVERIERKQRWPVLGGCKQRGEKAIPIRRADEPLAMGECILHGVGHGATELCASSRAVSIRLAMTLWSMPSLSLASLRLPCALCRLRDRSGSEQR